MINSNTNDINNQTSTSNPNPNQKYMILRYAIITLVVLFVFIAAILSIISPVEDETPAELIEMSDEIKMLNKDTDKVKNDTHNTVNIEGKVDITPIKRPKPKSIFHGLLNNHTKPFRNKYTQMKPVVNLPTNISTVKVNKSHVKPSTRHTIRNSTTSAI